jgi:hypothetical protein
MSELQVSEQRFEEIFINLTSFPPKDLSTSRRNAMRIARIKKVVLVLEFENTIAENQLFSNFFTSANFKGGLGGPGQTK